MINIGQCAHCGGALTVGHVCQPIFTPEFERGQILLPQLTEEDIRRIVREELEKVLKK